MKKCANTVIHSCLFISKLLVSEHILGDGFVSGHPLLFEFLDAVTTEPKSPLTMKRVVLCFKLKCFAVIRQS